MLTIENSLVEAIYMHRGVQVELSGSVQPIL